MKQNLDISQAGLGFLLPHPNPLRGGEGEAFGRWFEKTRERNAIGCGDVTEWVDESMGRGLGGVSFPLTPALSQKERGKHLPSYVKEGVPGLRPPHSGVL